MISILMPAKEQELLRSMKPDGIVYFSNALDSARPKICPVLFVENSNTSSWSTPHDNLFKILFAMRWTLNHFTTQVCQGSSVYGMLSNANYVQFLQLKSQINECKISKEIVVTYALDASPIFDVIEHYTMVSHILFEIAKNAKPTSQLSFPTESFKAQTSKPSGTNTSRNSTSKNEKKDSQANTKVQQVSNAPTNKMINNYNVSSILMESKKKQVLLATNADANEAVVLKLSTSTAEFDMLQLLKHHNVAQVTEAFTHTDGRHGIVMPKYATYKDAFETTCSVHSSVMTVAKCAIQLFDVISFLHQQGVYYGDISRHNVMFDSQGKIVLMDFDLAGHIAEIDEPSHFGTGIFVAPELDKKSNYSEKIDVYSCGILVIEWLRYALTRTKSSSVVECFEFFECMKRGNYCDAMLLRLLVIVQGCLEPQDKRFSGKEVTQLVQLLFKYTECNCYNCAV